MKKAKRAKKIIKISIAIIILLLISFWGYLRYSDAQSYQTAIPQNTAQLFKIDMQKVFKSMLGGYFNKKEKGKRASIKGISIPANIFVFTVKDKLPSSLFATLQINDIKAFEHSGLLEKYFAERTHIANGITIAFNEDKTCLLAYNTTMVAVAYTIRKEEVQDILTNLILKKNIVSVAQSNFKTIANQKGHITFLSDKGTGTLNFNNGNITASVTLKTEGISVPASVTHPVADNTSAISFWLYGDLTPLLTEKIFSPDILHISGDSLLATHPKGISVEITKATTQKDTVVAYEYNDNFEKVPVTKINVSSVPGIYFTIDTDAKSLYAYLLKQGLINSNSIINRKAFPLYQLYAFTKNNSFCISTSDQYSNRNASATSKDFFNLEINFSQMRKQSAFAFFNNYSKNLKELKATASKISLQEIKLEAALTFNNSNEQALWQLID